MLIWLASYPRSGSRLMRTALRSGWGIEGHSVFDRAERARRLGSRLPRRGPARDPRIRRFRKREGLQVMKTHLLVHARTSDPALVLVRDGRDSCVSYAHLIKGGEGPAQLRERSYEEVLLSLIEQRGKPFGSWSESVQAWTGRAAPAAIVRYEDLRVDPHGVARGALAELGLELGEPGGPMPSIEQMRRANPAVVRSGRTGGWREEMPERAIERFAELHGEALVRLGYEPSADPSRWATSLDAEG